MTGITFSKQLFSVEGINQVQIYFSIARLYALELT